MSLSGDLSLDAETGIDVGCTMFLEKCDAIGSSNPMAYLRTTLVKV